ncbi:MAG TPA: cytochrome P450 [Novosphingobium sp.]|nr:cytochrome P450 [Novosphingobium sp.]
MDRQASNGPRDLPEYRAELFSPASLRDPFTHYRHIRDLGPAVELPDYDVVAIGRFKDVQAALRQADVLISGQGVGFNALANHQTEERGVLTSDGERHRRLRGVIQQPLMPSALKERRAMLKALMEARVASLVGRDTFDAVPALAQHLPIGAVTMLVGLADEHRKKMLDWAAASFNTVRPLDLDGLDPKITDDLALLAELREYFATVDPMALVPGSWSAMLFDAVSRGKLSDTEARGALRSYVIPSLDTTIYAKANLLFNLASAPDQWRRLKADRSLVPAAVLEGVRHSAVARWFSRVAVEDYVAGDVVIPKGRRVMILYGSANRDERHYADPDRFDVTRNPVDQLGWGTGPHMCLGMHLAKLEMEVLLESLLEQVELLEVDVPTIGINAGLYGIDSLPMRLLATA